VGNGDCNFTRQGPGLLGVFVIFSLPMRDSSRASNVQCSATFSYALFMNGCVACAARVALVMRAFVHQIAAVTFPPTACSYSDLATS